VGIDGVYHHIQHFFGFGFKCFLFHFSFFLSLEIKFAIITNFSIFGAKSQVALVDLNDF
jgi:hypothetical protein